MGKIGIELNNFVIKENLRLPILRLQEFTLSKLDYIFNSKHIQNLTFSTEIGIGERGQFEGIENLMILIVFDYTYHFEFALYYDQLEYFIFNKEIILKKCTLEDYIEDSNEIVETFIKYLIRDIEKLSIPYFPE